MNYARNRRIKILVAAGIALLGAALVAARFQQEIAARGIGGQPPMRNFGVVWENKLTRSGLPTSKSGWEWLRQTRGVNSIVTFRPQNDVDYKKYGFNRVYRIPLSGTQVPTDEQVDTFLRFVQDPANWPVHIHCAAGRNRTGMMAVLVRYGIDGWPLDRALAESQNYRDGENLPEKRLSWLKSVAAKHSPGSYRLSSGSPSASSTGAWPTEEARFTARSVTSRILITAELDQIGAR